MIACMYGFIPQAVFSMSFTLHPMVESLPLDHFLLHTHCQKYWSILQPMGFKNLVCF